MTKYFFALFLVIGILLTAPAVLAQEAVYNQAPFWLVYPEGWQVMEVEGRILLSDVSNEDAMLIQLFTADNMPADIDPAADSILDVASYFAENAIESINEDETIEIVSSEETALNGYPAAVIRGGDTTIDFMVIVIFPQENTIIAMFAFTPPGNMDSRAETFTRIAQSLVYGESVETASSEVLYFAAAMAEDESGMTLNQLNLSSQQAQPLHNNINTLPVAPRSPDGSKMLFTAQEDDRSQTLYVIDLNCLDSSEGCEASSQQLASGFAEYRDAVWSPDNAHIAFIGASDSGGALTGDLYTVSINCPEDACTPNQITPTPGAWERSPTWSPTGTRIAFSSDYGGVSRLYVVNADGSNMAAITDETTPSDLPAWSQTGTDLAYISTTEVGGFALSLMKMDTMEITATTQAYYQPYLAPLWQPDGNKLLLRDGNTDFPGFGDLKLYHMASLGSSNLTAQSNKIALGMLAPPVWSPDRSQLAYTALSRTAGLEERLQIHIADMNTGVVLTRFSGFAPAFSPDGTQIAFFDALDDEIALDFENPALTDNLKTDAFPYQLGLFIASTDGSNRELITPVYAPVGLQIRDMRIFWALSPG